jgi:hypothetical protein
MYDLMYPNIIKKKKKKIKCILLFAIKLHSKFKYLSLSAI